MSAEPTASTLLQADWSRRKFLQALGLATGAVYARPSFGSTRRLPVIAQATGWPIFRLQRPGDLLSLHLELINLRIVSRRGYGREVHLVSRGTHGYLVLHFPGQHIAEQAIWDRSNREEGPPTGEEPAPPLTYPLARPGKDEAESRLDHDLPFLKQNREDPKTSPQGMAGAWLSGPSQIVFAVDEAHAPFTFEVETLLRLCVEHLPIVVAPQVQPRAPGAVTASPPPAPDIWLGHHAVENIAPFTAIEFPTLLYVSPYENARWRLRPRTGTRRSELWGLELEPPGTPRMGVPRELRAPGHLFAFAHRGLDEVNWPLPTEADPSGMDAKNKYAGDERPKTTLYEATRRLLVLQQAEDNGDITAHRFRLSALGATARESYKPLFEPPNDQPGNGEGANAETDEERMRALVRALLHFGCAIDGTQAANIAAAVNQHRALSRKDLFPKLTPFLEPPWIPDDLLSSIGEVFVNPSSVVEPRGLLSEWQQKTEVARDFYTKEAFAGFLMPFGFKAESVTITERLPSTDKPAELAETNKHRGPGLPGPDDLIEMREQESSLVAFLVARKFVRVKPWRNGTRRRDFHSAESADFAPWLGEAGRTAGLMSAEILVERTPVLANKGVKGTIDDLRDGKDYIVDKGSGVDAAREVFWPRVEAFVENEQGQKQRTLELYRFPVRLVYFDGASEVINLPMFFVPTQAQGRAYYPLTPRSQRQAEVKEKVAVVAPAPAALITNRDLGGGAEFVSFAQNHLSKFFADPKLLKLATEPPPTSLNKDKKLLHPLDSASGLTLVASSVNMFLDNVPDELARQVTQFRETIHGKIWELIKDEGTPPLSAKVERLVTWFAERLEKPKEDVLRILETADRLVAWGMEELGTVDAATAADRLAQIVQLPSTISSKELKPVKSAIGKLISHVEGLNGDLQKPKAALSKRLKRLAQALEQISGADDTSYRQALRELLIDWAVRLEEGWRREDWDKIFAECAAVVDPTNRADILTALFHKEVQYRLLEGETDIDLKIEDEPKLRIAFPALGPQLNYGGCAIQPQELRDRVDPLFEELKAIAVKDISALQRIQNGVEAGLTEERVLRQRLHFLLEEYPYRNEAERSNALQPILSDLRAQLVFASTHFKDGAERLRRFLGAALPAGQMVVHYQHEFQDVLNNKVKKFAQAAVVKQLENIGITETNPKDALKSTQESIERMLGAANPERIRQRFEEIVDLTGRRIGQEIRDRVRRVQTNAALRFTELASALENKRNLVLPSQFAEVAEKLEHLFVLAGSLAGKERALLDGVLDKASAEVQRDLRAALLALTKSQGLESVSGLKQWIGRALGIFAKTAISPRLLVMLNQLTADLEAGLQRAGRLPEETRRRLVALRGEIQQQLVSDLRDSGEKGKDRYGHFANEIHLLAKGAEGELQLRVTSALSVADKGFDVLDHLLLILAAAPASAEEAVNAVLKQFLHILVNSPIADFLGNQWGDIQDKLQGLRRYVGDAEDFAKAIITLPSDLQKNAEVLLKGLQKQSRAFATEIQKELKGRAAALDGEVFGMVKRALVALPSPEMLSNFADQSGKAIHEARDVIFNAAEDLGDGLRSFVAHPKLEGFTVKLPGTADFPEINHTVGYIKNGLRDFKSAEGAIYAQLANSVQAIGEAAGIGTAAAKIEALSREAGAVANEFRRQAERYVQEARKIERELLGEYDINDVKKLLQSENSTIDAAFKGLLGDPAPKIFGVIPLDKLLNVCVNLTDLPKAVPNNLGDRIEETKSIVKPITDKVDFAFLKLVPEANCNLRLEAHLVVYLPLPGREKRKPLLSTRGQLTNFTIEIGSVIGIAFKSLTFVSENGAFKCTPKFGKGEEGGLMDALKFMGPLEFVQSFAEALMSFLTGKIPFDLDFDGGVIYAKVVIGLPTLGFGAVAIENLTLRMAVGLPIGSGEPLTFKFEISDKIETFKVSVCGFAGGGYFGMLMSSDPQKGSIEAAIEFGGTLALNVGFATGSLSVMAGIYFKKRGTDVQLDAYIRACGVIRVLGFIEVSIIIYLSLSYRSETGALAGEVSITIRVKIGFFSKTFRLRYAKTIAGSRSSFLDRSPWEEEQEMRLGREPVFQLAGNGPLRGLGAGVSRNGAASEIPAFGAAWTASTSNAGSGNIVPSRKEHTNNSPREAFGPSREQATAFAQAKERSVRQFTDVMSEDDWLRHWRRFARGKRVATCGRLSDPRRIYTED